MGDKMPIIEWGAQSVRIALFTTTSVRIDDLYVIAFGDRPASYQQPPSPGTPFGNAQATGSGHDGQLTVMQIGLDRYDLVLAPNEVFLQSPPGGQTSQIAHALLKDVPACVALMINAAKLLVPTITSATRAAVTVDLAIPTPSLIEANQHLNAILPYSIKLKDESDFQLFINKKETFGMKSTFNMFSQWRVVPIQKINLTAQTPGSPTLSAQVFMSYYLGQKIIEANNEVTLEPFAGADLLGLLDGLQSSVASMMTIS